MDANNPISLPIIKRCYMLGEIISCLTRRASSRSIIDSNAKEEPACGTPYQLQKRTYPLELEERVYMTCVCRDADQIPKVADAGKVLNVNGMRVQIMHEGTRVIAGGYNGEWMERIITNLRGHHEPQEELIFHHLLQHVRQASLIVELGSFWAYYTNWYLGAVKGSSAVCIEPDALSMDCGLQNLALNGRKAHCINACVGAEFHKAVSLQRESDHALVSVPCHNMDSLMATIGRRPIEMLHIDVQGAELPFLGAMGRAAKEGLLRFIVVSTHHKSISESQTTHMDCVRELIRMGATILAEHSVEESFSGDGLIAASFLESDRDLKLPAVSRNAASASLFGPPFGESSDYVVAHTSFGPMVVTERDHVITRSLLTRKSFEENKISEVVAFLIRKFQFYTRNIH